MLLGFLLLFSAPSVSLRSATLHPAAAPPKIPYPFLSPKHLILRTNPHLRRSFHGKSRNSNCPYLSQQRRCPRQKSPSSNHASESPPCRQHRRSQPGQMGPLERQGQGFLPTPSALQFRRHPP